MSRGVKDLRELICVSRLSIVESDDEYESDCDGDDEDDGRCSVPLNGNNSGNLCSSEVYQSDLKPNGSLTRSVGVQKDAPCARSASSEPFLEGLSSQHFAFLQRARKKRNKRRQKVLAIESAPNSPTGNHKFPKKPPLPPVPPENWGTVALVPGSSRPRENIKTFQSRSPTLSDFPDGNFDSLLEDIDDVVISEWLETANKNLADISTWCRMGENFVRFAHFWLSELVEKRKVDILADEHRRLMEQMACAFGAGDDGLAETRPLTALLAAVFREYPDKLLGSKGARLFLEYLDILTSDRRDESYRLMLSDVKCATLVRRYAQYILAVRSVTLVSVWTTVVDIFRTPAEASKTVELSTASGNADLSQERMYQAVRYGFIDVMQYFLQSGKLSPKMRDENNKSLVFYAVVHNQPEVLDFLLTRVQRTVDVNEPADSGNTPLHAAANVGSAVLVGILLSADGIKVDAQNKHCDDATPLHLAVMHDHAKVVRQLLIAGANPWLTMGGMTPADIAKEFDHKDVEEILEKHAALLAPVRTRDSQTSNSIKST